LLHRFLRINAILVPCNASGVELLGVFRNSLEEFIKRFNPLHIVGSLWSGMVRLEA
jgi:hypothetical protein